MCWHYNDGGKAKTKVVVAQSYSFSSVQFSSVAQSCPTLCDTMNCSTPGLPVHHRLLEFTQTHVHRVLDAIQPSHPLSPPSPTALNPPNIRAFSNESALLIWWPKDCLCFVSNNYKSQVFEVLKLLSVFSAHTHSGLYGLYFGHLCFWGLIILSLN